MAAKKKAAKKKTAKRKAASRRELIDTGTNKLFVRRNARGTSFKTVVDAGKSITRDKRTKAKRIVIDSLVGFEMALAPDFRTDFRQSLYRMIAALTRICVTLLTTV